VNAFVVAEPLRRFIELLHFVRWMLFVQDFRHDV
jgi:hypothetical protein